MFINIILPVYNEEKRIENGVKGSIAYFEKINYSNYQLTIVDNASTDCTQVLAEQLAAENTNVKYLRLKQKGVGIAIREGVACNEAPIVGYMDIDLSTDVAHLRQVITLFQRDKNLAMVNGSRLNKKSKTIGRKWYRNITSYGLSIILKLLLGMKASDSICGFKFFRKEIIEELMQEAGNEKGWFLIIEILLRAERKKYKIIELPVRWKDDYNTTVHVGKLIRDYMKNIFRLRKEFKEEKIL